MVNLLLFAVLGKARRLVVAIAFVLLMATIAEARDVNIMQFSLLSFRDAVLSLHEYFSAYMLVPIAIKHFNARYTGIVPAIGSAKSCNVRLVLSNNRLHDTTGVSSVAMKKFVEEYAEHRIDVIHGLTLQEVGKRLLYNRLYRTDISHRPPRRYP